MLRSLRYKNHFILPAMKILVHIALVVAAAYLVESLIWIGRFLRKKVRWVVLKIAGKPIEADRYAEAGPLAAYL